jgi:type I restriction enzyme S subunit
MGWVKMKLGDVLKNREGRFKPNDPTIANLKRIDKINFSGQIFLSDKNSNTDMIIIKKGDLVISGINVEKGALTVYEGEEDILATIHYSSYIFDTSKIDIDFLKVFLRSPDFVQLLKEQVPGGIKTEIKPKHILPLEVYFPETTKEQKVIAEHFFEKEAKFNQLDEHISYQHSQLENLNQAILQEAVQGKLVSQDSNDEPASVLLKRIKAEKAKSGKKEKPLPPIKPEEIPFEIPENWVWCRLGEISDNITKGSSPNWQGVQYVSEKDGILFITSKNVDSFKLDLTKATYVEEKFNEIEPRSILKKGDILTNIVGASIGRTALFDLDVVANINQAVCIIRIEHSLINKDYMLNLMNSNLALKLMTDSSFAPGRANLSMGNIANFPIPLPPLSEQKRIVAEIEKQFAKTKQLKEHIIANQQATEQLLKALLHQAFEVKEMETA